jgi:hypothetical protein
MIRLAALAGFELLTFKIFSFLALFIFLVLKMVMAERA